MYHSPYIAAGPLLCGFNVPIKGSILVFYKVKYNVQWRTYVLQGLETVSVWVLFLRVAYFLGPCITIECLWFTITKLRRESETRYDTAQRSDSDSDELTAECSRLHRGRRFCKQQQSRTIRKSTLRGRASVHVYIAGNCGLYLKSVDTTRQSYRPKNTVVSFNSTKQNVE